MASDTKKRSPSGRDTVNVFPKMPQRDFTEKRVTKKEQLEEWDDFPLTFPLTCCSQLHVQSLRADN